MINSLVAIALLAFSALLASPLQGQFGLPRSLQRGNADSTAVASARMSPESPRASVTAFLELAQQHKYAQAAQYLDIPVSQRARSADLARRLREVLDQRLWIEMENVSPLAIGDTSDGEPGRDRLGVVPGATGLAEPVYVRRFVGGRVTRWVFDRETVESIDDWHAALPDAWLRGRVPTPLLGEGPFGVYYWQWIGMALAVVACLALAAVIALAARYLLALVTARTATTWDELLVSRLRGPFRMWLVGVLAMPLFAVLGLNARVAGFISATSSGLVLLSVFWAALRVISLVQDQLLLGSWADGQAQTRTLVPLLTRFLRVTVTIVALLVVLAQFGYPVGTLLAGIGIGGVALALASQKTVEHLFGSVSLAADKVFRVGDFVRIGTVEGTVERIGLRSTSVRTLERTIVRIPNGSLAEERIETFGERDRFLFEHFIGVTYSTTPSQIRTIVAAIEARLREHPDLWPETIVVRANAFGESAISIRVRAWFTVADFVAFLDVQHEILLACMDIVEAAGSSFAFPSRTVYHVSPTESVSTNPTANSTS